jgi:AraC family transcriptional regulator of adaptative response/methylated-DNA-[protein]-cysteine methyltransferase
MNNQPSELEMQRAVLSRDASYDGVFFVAVRTTGVFCRPSCGSRKPLPRNIEYYRSVREALAAGYRPCKRCRPLDTNGKPPEWVRQLLARIERVPATPLRDADLRSMAIDPARARRFFQKRYGVTFQGYQRLLRLGSSLMQIRRGADLMSVGWDHGYESSSGFRAAFGRIFGSTPGRSRTTDCILTELIETPLGPLIAAANPVGICLLEFTERRALRAQLSVLRKRMGCAIVPGHNEQLAHLKDELERYFAGTLTEFGVPLVAPGTAFQRSVWERLRRIRYGHTRSYEQMARELGKPGAQRAVGRANGDNRVAILIPCHRVVRNNGELGGYGGGLWRKQFLLEHERRVLAMQTTFDAAASNGRETARRAQPHGLADLARPLTSEWRAGVLPAGGTEARPASRNRSMTESGPVTSAAREKDFKAAARCSE